MLNRFDLLFEIKYDMLKSAFVLSAYRKKVSLWKYIKKAQFKRMPRAGARDERQHSRCPLCVGFGRG